MRIQIQNLDPDPEGGNVYQNEITFFSLEEKIIFLNDTPPQFLSTSDILNLDEHPL